MTDWRPIESAFDARLGASPVLGFAERTLNGRPRSRELWRCSMVWSDMWQSWMAIPGYHQISPTHWMPLPELPISSSEPNPSAWNPSQPVKQKGAGNPDSV